MIQINNDWKLETDQYNVILQQRKIAEKGKNIGGERWETVGYYGDYKAALCAMVDLAIKVPTEFIDVVNLISDLKADIMDLPNADIRRI